MSRPKQVYTFFSLYLAIIFSSCNVWQYVPEDEQLLIVNEINILDSSTPDIDDKDAFISRIRALDSVQRVNTKNFGFRAKLNKYYKLSSKGKVERLEKKLNSNRIELPSYYREGKSTETAELVTGYLKNLGYFHAHTSAKDTVYGKKAKTVYDITLNRLIRVGELKYFYPNDSSGIATVLKPEEKNSILGLGAPLTQNATAEEYDRLTLYLQKNGYAFFTSQNIFPIAGPRPKITDSTASAFIGFRNDEVGNTLKSYRVGSIKIDRYYDPFNPTKNGPISQYNGFDFYESSTAYNHVKKKHVARNILFNPGELYNIEAINKTRERLSQLRYFQSPNISFSHNPLDSNLLDFNIRMTPLSRYTFSIDGGLNYFSSEPQLWGFSGALSLTDQNFWGGSEIFTTSIDGEFQYILGKLEPNQRRRNIVTYGIGFGLQVPRFYNYLGLYNLTKNWTIGGINFLDLMETYSTSNFKLEYRYEEFVDEQKSSTITGQAGFKVAWPNGRHDLSITHFDFSLFDPTRGINFDDQSNPLRDKSFNTTLFTSVLLGELLYNYRSRNKEVGWNYQSSSLLDFSGLEAMGVDALFNRDDTLKFFGDIEFARFIRFDQSHTVTRKFIDNTSFVSRLNYGIAVPLWGSAEIPFVKQFSLGGSQSMRAWNYRELGIGGYNDLEAISDSSNTTYFYQSGDVKLELNLEYRFPINFISLGSIGNLNGALFTDIGNIWSLDNSEEQQNFSGDFIQQLAVGSGIGLRADFSFLIIRLDAAWKIRNPFPNEDGTYYAGGRDFFYNFTRTPRWNIGIGYPF